MDIVFCSDVIDFIINVDIIIPLVDNIVDSVIDVAAVHCYQHHKISDIVVQAPVNLD